MNFGLIDRILELTTGERIVAETCVSPAEDYLADHFPTFPVMPGVLMLEAMVESAAWLVRDAQDFSSSVVLLKSARNVTYKSFVRPGEVLTLTVTCRRLASGDSDFSGIGHCRGDEVVRARFALAHFCLRDRDARHGSVDQRMADAARAKFAGLRGGFSVARDAD